MGQRLGQHFLTDIDILDSIVECADISPNDVVVEIGPGKGDLTRRLLEKGAIVHAVELDSVLYTQLIAQKDFDDATLYNDDALSFDFSIFASTDFKVVANLPYHITARFVRTITELKSKPKTMTLLIQKEVAQRIVATSGKHSLLSLASQIHANVELGPIVPPEAFSPPPKVTSQVVKLTFRNEIAVEDEKLLFSVLKIAFNSKRKKLSNTLQNRTDKSREEIEKILSDIGASINARPQELSLDQWIRFLQSCDL